jgi:hypothetical protein
MVGFFSAKKKGISAVCVSKCDYTCETCSSSENSCDTCLSKNFRKLNGFDCNCFDGYYDVG